MSETKRSHGTSATMTTGPRASGATRRDLFGIAAGAAIASIISSRAFAQSDEAAQKIADHFSSVKSMMGEFMQFSPRNDQTSGKFFIQRPGKLRFNYDDPSPLRVIADGANVVIGNLKLKTWDVYPLSKTPLSLLLADRIDLQHQMVRNVQQTADLTTIVLGDKSLFGDQVITLMFDPKTYDLRQWTTTDAQGKDTTVVIFNVKTGVHFDDKVFAIPYDEVRGLTGKKN